MKIVAIVAEYNPLHTGHCYHIDETKRSLSPDILAVVQSGNFCQRGDIAVVEKHRRAATAIQAGADVVLELPVYYAVNCAEKFAEGATKVLSCFNSPLTLSFGSECGDLTTLEKLSQSVHNESAEISQTIKSKLDEGCLYAKARAEAHGNAALDAPNNVLALEYVSACKKHDFDYFTVKRTSDYNSTETAGEYASATAIRDNIFKCNFDKISRFLPNFSMSVLNNCISNESLTDMLLYKISSLNAAELSQISEVAEGLENRIISAAKTSKSYTELCDNIKSKRYSMARIKRILLYTLFGLTKQVADNLYSVAPYARVLAARSNRPDILSLLSNASGGLIVREKDLFSLSTEVKEAVAFEKRADSIYAVAAKSAADFNAVFID